MQKKICAKGKRTKLKEEQDPRSIYRAYCFNCRTAQNIVNKIEPNLGVNKAEYVRHVFYFLMS